MSKTKYWLGFALLLLAVPQLISVCDGGNSPPTPAGQADGRPTLIYLWNFP